MQKNQGSLGYAAFYYALRGSEFITLTPQNNQLYFFVFL